MIFSIYPRKGQSNLFRHEFLRVRGLYESGKIIEAYKEIDYLIMNADKRLIVFLESALAMMNLYQETSTQFRDQVVDGLYQAINSLDLSSQLIDADVVHDIQSMLRLRGYSSAAMPPRYDLLELRQKNGILGKFTIPRSKYFGVRIPRTGFFSFLEHVSLISFYADMTGSFALIDASNWSFPIHINQFFSAPSCSFVSNDFDGHRVRIVPSQRFRNLLDRSDDVVLQSLALHKCKLYKGLVTTLQVNLLKAYPSLSSILDSSYNVLFMRMGDKANQEVILPSQENILASFQDEKPHIIISDDTNYATSLANLRGSADLVCGLREMTGYEFINDGHDFVSFMDVAYKWLLMVKAGFLIACPTSNIVNTAFAARSSSVPFVASRGFFIRPMVHI